MATYRNARRMMMRRIAVLITLVAATGGLLALEHTSTGAATGNPTATHLTSHDKRGPATNDEHHHNRHHPTSSSTTTSTTTTSIPTSHGPGKPRPCHVGHGRGHKKFFRCRPPSGAPSTHNPHEHGY